MCQETNIFNYILLLWEKYWLNGDHSVFDILIIFYKTCQYLKLDAHATKLLWISKKSIKYFYVNLFRIPNIWNIDKVYTFVR